MVIVLSFSTEALGASVVPLAESSASRVAALVRFARRARRCFERRDGGVDLPALGLMFMATDVAPDVIAKPEGVWVRKMPVPGIWTGAELASPSLSNATEVSRITVPLGSSVRSVSPTEMDGCDMVVNGTDEKEGWPRK